MREGLLPWLVTTLLMHPLVDEKDCYPIISHLQHCSCLRAVMYFSFLLLWPFALGNFRRCTSLALKIACIHEWLVVAAFCGAN